MSFSPLAHAAQNKESKLAHALAKVICKELHRRESIVLSSGSGRDCVFCVFDNCCGPMRGKLMNAPAVDPHKTLHVSFLSCYANSKLMALLQRAVGKPSADNLERDIRPNHDR